MVGVPVGCWPEGGFDSAVRAELDACLCHRPADAHPRWTLDRIIAECAACADYSVGGCSRLLRRLGFRLRRGRPRLFSPDPAYAEKREQLLAALRTAAAAPGRRVVLFLDECTYYHWPLAGRAWWRRRGPPPRAERAGRGEITRRIVATLDVCSGRVLADQHGHISTTVLLRFLARVAAAYPDAEHIAIVLDNWPVHRSPAVQAAVAAMGRVELLFLPTYAPWLNPIEKLWALLKAEVLRLHPYAGRWTELTTAVTRFLGRYAEPSPALLVALGLRGTGALAAALHPLTDLQGQT